MPATDPAHDPIRVVKGLYDAFGRGDLDAVVAALVDDCEWTCHAPPSVPFHGEFSGRDGVRRFFERLAASMRIESCEPRRFLADGDTVVVLGHDVGTAFLTGHRVSYDWVHVFALRDGAIAEFHEFVDATSIDAAFRAHLAGDAKAKTPGSAAR